MINPLLNKQHLKQYFLYGSAAALVYIIPYIIFLIRNDYENFYILFIGSGLFMLTIFIYTLKLIRQPYDKKRTLSMIFSGHLATITGVLIATVLVVMIFFFFFPNVFTTTHPDQIVEDLPAAMRSGKPSGILFPILFITTLGNFGVGSFISLITAYAGKLNQTKDEPVSLETRI
ncbi:MAG: hypothetical protein E6H08_10170 [Bacteroidetes bacterium]|jgi:hypothetical protein|nr:MAG: hypothetical protein E6H08_10170 [Bacteroidota bacterium]